MAGETSYWARLYDNERHLGGCFLVAPGVVLTAAHCVASVPDGQWVVVRFSPTEWAHAVVEQVADGDLALLALTGTPEVQPPHPGRAQTGDEWRAPCRPAEFEALLTGEVTTAGVDFTCADGSQITALQLLVAQELADFSGYSGGPIEVSGAVTGILLEQAPERARGERAANVLFGAALGDALVRFRRFTIGHLFAILSSAATGVPRPRPSESLQPPSRKRRRSRDEDADVKLRQLKQWMDDGVVTPLEAEPLRLRILSTWLGADR